DGHEIEARQSVEGDEELHELRPVDPVGGGDADAVRVAVRLDVEDRDAAAVAEDLLELREEVDELLLRRDPPEFDGHLGFRSDADRLELIEELASRFRVAWPQPFDDVHDAEGETVVHGGLRPLYLTRTLPVTACGSLRHD